MVLNSASAAGPARGPVVVTGADGFAGRAACARFRVSGIPFRGLVRALSITTAARPDMLPVGDLTEIADDALMRALEGADIVLHLAGRAHLMRENASDPLSAFRAINVTATERVARAAAAAGAAHFVFASSVKVNGEVNAAKRPFREIDPPDPRDAYAISKWEAERVLGGVARETGLPVTVLRLPLLYGPWVKGNIARLTDAIARGVPLPLGSIDNRRSLLGAGNFVSALEVLYGHPPPVPGTVATYLLADAEPVATPELVRAIATALGVTARLVSVPPPLLRLACACVGRTAAIDRLLGSLVVDAGAFRGSFGWQPPRGMAEELADMVRARREGPSPHL